MIGGIDQQIQQKVDAYRGNPQQLMQRYQQNQELIDLLALQKLKSEKDAAAREMQMQMQTTPQTIKDQREAELLGRTKDEMVQQTSGIMQERAKRQQQNMQRTANQGLPQLPAGNMQQMAGGGIVSFAEGGAVEGIIDDFVRKGADAKTLMEVFGDDPNARRYIEQKLMNNEIRKSGRVSMGRRPAEGMSIPDRAPTIDTGNIMSLLGPRKTKPYKPLEEAAAKRSPIGPDPFGGVGLYGGERAPTAEGKGDGAGGFGGFVDGVREILRQMQESAAQTPGGPVTEGATLNRELRGKEGPGGLYEGQTAPQTEVNRPDSMTVPQIDPRQQQMDLRQQQMDQLQEIDTSGLAGLKKESLSPRELYEANRSVLSKELLRQQSPEELEKERRRAFYYGGLRNGGRGGFGGRGAAMADVEAMQKARELQGIEKLMGVDKELMTMDQEAQKMELEKESTRLLGEIRQGQLTAAQMNSIAGEISSMTEQVEDALVMDNTYRTLDEQYQEAVEDGDKAMAETLLRQREQYRQSKIKSMYPNYADLVKTQKELNQKMLGSAGFGKVERLSQ